MTNQIAPQTNVAETQQISEASQKFAFALGQIVSPKLLGKPHSEFTLMLQKELLTRVFMSHLRTKEPDLHREDILNLYEGLHETLDAIYCTVHELNGCKAAQ